MAEFEANPPMSVLERVSTMLTEKGIQIKDQGSGGIPELSTQDYAAMLAGVSHSDKALIRTADALFWVSLIRDERRRADLHRELHHWGCSRFMLLYPGVKLSGQHHGQIVRAVVRRVADGANSLSKDMQADCKIGSDRWKSLEPHVNDLIRRCRDAENLLVEHLRRQLGTETVTWGRQQTA